MKAASCTLCGGAGAYPTAEPTIVDPWEPAAMRHPTVAQHHRRVLATDTPLCAGCMELISFLPAVALERELADHGVEAATLEAAGDALVSRRPLTKARRSLACACWLAADARTVSGAAEALSGDGDVEAWIFAESTRQGVEVVS